MNNSMISAVVSLGALQQKLDVIAGNIAGIDINGFKRKEAVFEDVLTNVKQQPNAFRSGGRLTPLGFTQGYGSRLSQVRINMEQGSMQLTGLPTDLAIEGNALFEVQVVETDEQGNLNAHAAWTRNGAFQLTQANDDPDFLYLADHDGNFVLGTDDQPIRVPVHYTMAVDEYGNVSATSDADPTAPAIPVGQLKLVRVLRPQSLENAGDHLFVIPRELDAEAAAGILTAIDLNNPADEDDRIAVRQGTLEKSNVSLADELTELITVQRAYELTSRAIVSGDTMMNLTNNLRA